MSITQIIGLVVVLALAALAGFFIIKKSGKHDLIKWVSLFFILSLVMTWIFAYGYFNGAEFSDYGMSRLGFTDIPNILYYGMNFAGDKIIYLLALGCFYGVLSRVEGYKKLVTKIAEKFKGKEIIFVICTSLLFTALTSLLSQTFIVLLFVPFMISVILSMKLDKLTAFSATFGSILVGLIGITYGGEGSYWFNYYVGLTVKTGIIYRLIVCVLAFILFNFINVLHIKKVLKNKVEEVDADPFKVEKVDKKAKMWPIVVVFVGLFIITILGYVAWSDNFGITWFSDVLHTKLMELKIGDVEIFKALLGTLATDAPFGSWNLFHASILLVVVSFLIALIGRVKFNDFITAYGDGAKKMSKSIILFVGIYMVMIAAYMSPYMPTIINTMFSGISKFNPFLTSIGAFLANIVHSDFGFTGYVVGTFFTSKYAEFSEAIHLIFTTMYGFVQLCIPTSAILMIGLAYLNIEYKTWMKYIWMFVVGILVVLLVLFAIITYV